ncbi:unnamed protein product [Durusdinium trenchii]|uniref:GPS domain-containing protein n=1 Tax=Durusdinium trenchii TaxID=1381693 RepID=A0ABP0NRP7_9DINO
MPTRLALHVLLAAFHVVRGSVWAREDRGLSASTDVGDDSEDWFEEMLGRRVAVPRSFKASPMTLGASQAMRAMHQMRRLQLETTTSSSTSSTTTTSSSTSSSSSSSTTTTTSSSSSSTSSTSTTTTTSSSTSSSSSSSTTTTTSSSSSSSSSSSTTTTTSSSTSSSSSSSTTTTTSSSSSSTSSTSTTTTTSSSTSSSTSTTTTSTSSSTSSSTSTRTTTSSSTSSTSSTSTTSVTSTTTSTSGTSTTTTTSSFLPEDVVELLDLLNRQRKNEAAGAVRDVASSEEEQVKAQVSALLEAANQSEGAIPQVTNETDTGTVTVMAFTSEAVEAARRTGAAVPVSTGGADAAEVPSQVLAQAMEMAAAKVGSDKAVVLSLTAINDATAEKLQVPIEQKTTSVQSQRLSINLWDEDGKPIEIDKPLREPIKLRFEVNNSDPSLRCAFWDEIEAKWSEEGLKTVSMDGKQLECETVHLSIFAAVVFSIENVAACSTAMYLLSDEGFRNLFDVTGWGSSVQAVFFGIFLSICVLALTYFCYLDIVSAREMGLLSGETESEAAKDTKKPEHVVHHVDEAAQRGCGRCSQLLEGFSVLAICSTLKQVCLRTSKRISRLPCDVANKCVSALHSYKTGVESESVKVLLEKKMGEMRAEHQMPTTKNQRRRAEHGQTALQRNTQGILDTWEVKRGMQEQGRKAVECVLDAPFYWRVVLFLPVFQPLIGILLFSLRVSHSKRASLLILKFLTAGAASALFYGGVEQEGCTPPRDALDDLIRTIVVSFVCLCLGDLMILLLTLIGRRSVATSLCVVYILLFLSNMHPADVQKWFESSAWSLAQGLILKPLAMSLVMNTLLSIALSFSRVRLAIKTTWLLKGIEVHMTPEEEDQLKRAFEEAQQNQDGPTSVFSMLDVIREDSTAKGDMTYTDALQMTRKIVIREDAESRVDEEVKEPPRVKRKMLRRVRRRRHPNLAGQVPLSNIEQGQSPEVSAAPIVKRKVLRDRRVKRRRHPNLAGQAPLSNIEQGQSPEGTEQLGMCAIVLDVEEEQEVESVAHLSGTR